MPRNTTENRQAGPQRQESASWLLTLRELLALASTAAPIAAVGLMNLAISLTDMVMMAYLDRNALTAGAIVSDVYSMIFQFSAGILSAVTPHVARAYAANDANRVGVVVGYGMRLAACAGFCGFLLVFFMPDILGSVGSPLPLAEVAASYAHFMAGTFLLMLVIALARSTFPALGKGTVPLAVMAAAVPLNALANAVLMYGWLGMLPMGLAGAGAASLVVAAACASTLIVYGVFAPAMRRFQFARNFISTPRFLSPELVKSGIATGAASLCETGVFLSSTVLVAMFAADSVPAHVGVFRALAVSYVILSGYGQAVTIHLSRAALTPHFSAHVAVRNAAIVGAVVLWVAFLVALCLSPELIRLFGQTDTGVDALAPWAAVAASSLVAAVVAFAILRARLDVSMPTAISFFGYWLVGFDAMLILAWPCGYGALGIWIGLAMGATTTAVGSWLYLAFRQDILLSSGSLVAQTQL